MSTPDRAKVREIVAEALDVPPDRVPRFLDQACSNDVDLRREVESLLSALAKRPGFLVAPTGDAVARANWTPGEALGSRIGPYTLLEEIGHGGFGTVYQAEQEQPVRRRVAIKVIRLGMDTRAVVARFEAERQALAMMDHPHIAKVLDAGATDSGRPYFVMELVRGESITAYADQHALSVSERLHLFMQVCHAVQHAHSKGVIHRDIKPGNVLVSTQDGRPHAKVIDFGIAKATEAKLTERTLFTEFHQLLGTPEYMSPEQAGGAPDVDTRSDVYSLGTLLYELLTGMTPLDSKTLRSAAYDEMRRIIREVEPPRPSTRLSHPADPSPASSPSPRPSDRLASRVSGDLDWIVMKAIDKDRSRRYQTASALADDLHRHLSGEPVVAAPPSVAYRVRKFARRHRAAVAGASAVACTLVLGIVGTSLGLVAATNSRRDSQEQAARAEAESKRAGDAEAAAIRAKDQAEYDAYIANIESAYGALQFNDTTRLLARLQACPPERRNWEWRYLHAASDTSEMALTHPARAVVSTVISRDGSRVLSSCNDGKARLWNPATGVELAAWSGPTRFRGVVAFSPDGSRAIAAAEDGQIWVWDSVQLREVTVLKGHSAVVTFAAFVDQDTIVSTSDDATARLWDARDGRELRRMSHEGPIHRADLHLASARLATASRDRTVHLWNMLTANEPTILRGHTNSVVFVRWSSDGTRVVSASYDSTSRVWDAASADELSRFTHDGRATFARFSSDGTRVVSGATSGPALVWDARSGKELFRLSGHTNTVIGGAFSADDRLILTRARDNTVRLWDAATGEEWSCLRGHVETPWISEFTPNGRQVITCGDSTVRLWAIPQSREHNIIPLPKIDSATASIDRDARHLLSIGRNRVRWIDRVDSTEVDLFERTDPTGTATILPDSMTVMVAFSDNSVRSMNVASRVAGPSFVGHSNGVYAIDSDAEGRKIVTSSEDGTARIWDASTGREILVLRGHEGAVNSARFDPTGTRIVTAGRDKTVRLWDAATGAELLVLRGHENAVQFACFDAAGRRILSTSAEFASRVWEADTGKPLFVLRGHEHVVFRGSFSPDGTRIATCSMDGTVRVWDAANGRQILSMRGRSGGITKAEFCADGARLFVVDTEGRAWLHDTLPPRDRAASERH